MKKSKFLSILLFSVWIGLFMCVLVPVKRQYVTKENGSYLKRTYGDIPVYRDIFGVEIDEVPYRNGAGVKMYDQLHTVKFFPPWWMKKLRLHTLQSIETESAGGRSLYEFAKIWITALLGVLVFILTGRTPKETKKEILILT